MDTITNPGVDIRQWQAVAGHALPEFLKRLRQFWVAPVWSESELRYRLGPRVCMLNTSGPNSRAGSPSMASYLVDAVTWTHHPLFPVLERWFELVGRPEWAATIQTSAWFAEGRGVEPHALGKLGVKEEPGKVRVFAMVDCWTQWALRPLHKLLFDILRKIPQDGTFDQLAPIRLLLKDYPKEMMYSFDLSAATDRLPVALQEQLLNQLLPFEMGTMWRSLLCGRSYVYRLETDDGTRVPIKKGVPPNGVVTYSVGQPMGAYSSWGMLALTHHFIVQWASMRAGIPSWFPAYAVLGDDVVIANDAVASKYLEIMLGLGVTISAPKTLKGVGSLEFAKRFFWKGQDASPVSLLEYAVSTRSVTALVELVRKVGSLGTLRLSSVLRAFGFGYRVFASASRPVRQLRGRIQGLLISLYAPGAGPWASPDWTSWFLETGIGTKEGSVSRVWQHIQDTYLPRLRDIVKLQFTNYAPNLWGENVAVYEYVPMPVTISTSDAFDRLTIDRTREEEKDPLVKLSNRQHRAGRYPSVVQYGWWKDFIVSPIWLELMARFDELRDRLDALETAEGKLAAANVEEFAILWQLFVDLVDTESDVGRFRDMRKRAKVLPPTKRASRLIQIFRASCRIVSKA